MTADLELLAIGVPEEERPLVAEPLDLADVGAGGHQPVPHFLQRGERVDGQGEVVDRAPAALAAPVADDLIRSRSGVMVATWLKPLVTGMDAIIPYLRP